MQASNARPGSLDAPQKASRVTSHTVQKLKIPGLESDPSLSPNPVSRTPKNRSPKIVGRQSPRSPATEKKKPSRVSELESQIAQLEEELKKAKDQLSSVISLRQRAQQEAEEAKEQLAAMSVKLEETQKQLKELSDSEARLPELRKISHDRDRAWKSELEALNKQHSMDSSALASAMNEIHNLKIQLDRVSESEVSHARHAESACVEIQRLRCELNGTLELVDKLKIQLKNTRESEAQVIEDVSKAQMQLKDLKNTEETLHFKHAIAMESYKNLILELEESKNRVVSLEEVVRSLRSDLGHSNKISAYYFDDVKTEVPKNELMDLKHEVDSLRSALEIAERRHQDDYNRSTLEINNANELLENVKSESFKKQLEIEAKIKEYQVEAGTLSTKLIERDNDLKSISQENKGLSLKIEEDAPAEREYELETELEKSESLLKDLHAYLLEKETQLQTIREENKILKSEILKKETERNEATNEAIALTEASRAAEQEALIKIGYLTEESEKSRRKIVRVTEQLDATQAANLEMETELRRLKVQSDQWRKAAEAAAAMLSTENNGKYVKRTGSLDYHTVSGKLGSPYSEDINDDFGKKKNGNMLKKIGGVLLKKGQK